MQQQRDAEVRQDQQCQQHNQCVVATVRRNHGCQCLDHEVGEQDADQDSEVHAGNDFDAFASDQQVADGDELGDKQQDEEGQSLIVFDDGRHQCRFSGDCFRGDVRKDSAGTDQQVGYSQKNQQHGSASKNGTASGV